MKNLFRSAIVVYCLLMFANLAFADGMIFPVDPEERIRPSLIFIPPERPTESFTVPLSVTKHHVKINISNKQLQYV